MSKENLERVMDLAGELDLKTAEEAWFRYNRIVGAVAANYGFPLVVGAAVFSALSPNNDYLGNLRDVKTLLAAAQAGLALEDFSVSAYGNNKRKAWLIAHGTNPLDVIVFPKTRNFFLNVLDPADPVPVTVDGHIFNAWANTRLSLASAAQKGRAKLYNIVANDIRQIGAERRMLPNVVQGVIWYVHKRIHRIRWSAQLSFWEEDYYTAGLGLVPCVDFSKTLETPELTDHPGHSLQTSTPTPRCS